jgi:hypothetical protein
MTDTLEKSNCVQIGGPWTGLLWNHQAYWGMHLGIVGTDHRPDGFFLIEFLQYPCSSGIASLYVTEVTSIGSLPCGNGMNIVKICHRVSRIMDWWFGECSILGSVTAFCSHLSKNHESYLVDESVNTLTMWECHFGAVLAAQVRLCMCMKLSLAGYPWASPALI